MRSTDVPRQLFDQFKESDAKQIDRDCYCAKFGTGHIVWREDFPRTVVRVYLEGYSRERGHDFEVRAPAVSAMLLEYEVRQMDQNVKLQQLRARAEELYRSCEDYHIHYPMQKPS